jgi:hypothetical protein
MVMKTSKMVEMMRFLQLVQGCISAVAVVAMLLWSSDDVVKVGRCD